MNHKLLFLTAKDTKQTWPRAEFWRKSGTSFQESPPSGLKQDVLNSFNNELWQHVFTREIH